MTDCALQAAPAPTRTAASARPRRLARTRRDRPGGVPWWVRLLGVAIVPVGEPDGAASRTWVLSAGAGTSHVAALLADEPSEPTQSADC